MSEQAETTPVEQQAAEETPQETPQETPAAEETPAKTEEGGEQAEAKPEDTPAKEGEGGTYSSWWMRAFLMSSLHFPLSLTLLSCCS